jgi:hypothetical protein
MDLARAKAISDVAQTIINVAKVEVDMVKAAGIEAPTSGFFSLLPAAQEDRDISKHAESIERRRQITAAKSA